MKNKNTFKLILALYLVSIISIYIWLIYPIIISPKGLVPTNIPTLAVDKLKNAELLFASMEKEWSDGLPVEPNLSNFIFGQQDPI